MKLAAAKMAKVDVRFAYISQPNMAPSMEKGAIDGFIGSAPFSTLAVAKGLGVTWVNGPGGDLPEEFTPVNAGLVMVMRNFIETQPDIVKRLVAAFTDFGNAVEQRPADVKATVARLYPDLDPPTLDLFFSNESRAWSGKQPTAKDMEHEISFVKESGAQLPNLERLNPAAMILP